jgi:ubiquinol-cytochrome c reductase cytochrome b subunit
MPAEEPYATISLIASVYWFAYFLVILPLLGVMETPNKQPESIAAAFEEKYPSKKSKVVESTKEESYPDSTPPAPAE